MAQPFTFINQNAKRRGPSKGDLFAINAHIAKVTSKRRQDAKIYRREDCEDQPHQGVRSERDSFHSLNLALPRQKGLVETEKGGQTSAPEHLGSYTWPPLLTDYHIGGHRDDPFKMLPITSTLVVTRAFDYYHQVYAPLAIRLGSVNTQQSRIASLHMLHDAMFFESTVAMMLMVLNSATNANDRVSKELLLHSNNAMATLRGRLSSPDTRTSDEVVMAILIQAIMQRMVGNISVFNHHLNGLRSIIRMRGGIDQLGWNGFVKICVKGVLESATVMEKRQQQGNADQTATPSSTDKLSRPILPTSKFIQISPFKFAPGFHNLAREGKVSVTFLEYLDSFSSWYRHKNGNPLSITELTREILSIPGLTKTERLLAVALQGYINYVERTDRPGTNTVTELEIGILNSTVTELDIELLTRIVGVSQSFMQIDEEVLMWACLMVKATTDPESDAQRWADTVISFNKFDYSRQEHLEALFFPLPRPPDHISRRPFGASEVAD